MRLGIDYYPEHWDESRWPIDARLMREAGLKVVRLAEFAWSRLEPAEGRYDFAWLDRALAILYGEGIQAVLGTPTAAPPAWLHEKHPDLYTVDENRLPKGFGTRLQRCLNHPMMRHHSRLITEAMAAHYATHPAVIGWQTDNEFTANLCHCDHCAAGFRAWLQARYGSLEALNAAWGTVFWSQEYSAWPQVPLPWTPHCGRRAHNPSLLLDFQRFQSDSTVHFQHEQVEIIHRLAPGQFITHNTMAAYDSSLDLHKLSEDLDFISVDAYVWGHYGHYPNPAAMHDATRGIKQANYWVMEKQSGITGWMEMSRRPHDGQLRQWVWQAIGHGADTVVFFRWRSCLYGTEQYWHGILNHDGVPRRRYRLFAGLAREIEALSPELDGSTVVNEVAILTSYEQNWAFQIQPQTKGLEWWTQLRRYHEAFASLGVGVDIVPLSVDLPRYKLVVLPSWYLLTAADAAKIAAYVRGGGTVILSPRTGVKRADNSCEPLPLPGLLREVAGLEVDEYDALGGAESAIRLADGREFPVTVWADALTMTGAEALAHYTQPLFIDEPAIGRNRFGQGTCYTLGVYGQKPFYQAFFGGILAELGIGTIPELPEGVDVCRRRKGNDEFLFLINLTHEPRMLRLHDAGAALLGASAPEAVVELPPFGVAIQRVTCPATIQFSLI